MLDTLADFRNRMIAITDRVEPHLRTPTEEGILDLAKSRAELARVLSIYNLFVHREIFEPMMQSGSASQRPLVVKIKSECILLTEEFRAFARNWHTADVSAAWANYQPEAMSLLRRIRRHLDDVILVAPITPDREQAA